MVFCLFGGVWCVMANVGHEAGSGGGDDTSDEMRNWSVGDGYAKCEKMRGVGKRWLGRRGVKRGCGGTLSRTLLSALYSDTHMFTHSGRPRPWR